MIARACFKFRSIHAYSFEYITAAAASARSDFTENDNDGSITSEHSSNSSPKESAATDSRHLSFPTSQARAKNNTLGCNNFWKHQKYCEYLNSALQLASPIWRCAKFSLKGRILRKAGFFENDLLR